MNELTQILREAEKRLTDLLGDKVYLSISFTPIEGDNSPSKSGGSIRNKGLEQLLSIICAEFMVTETELYGPQKKGYLTDARGAFCYLVNKHIGMHPTRISEILNRDRTSVLHSIKRVKGLLEVNDPIKRKIESVEREFSKLNNI